MSHLNWREWNDIYICQAIWHRYDKAKVHSIVQQSKAIDTQNPRRTDKAQQEQFRCPRSNSYFLSRVCSDVHQVITVPIRGERSSQPRFIIPIRSRRSSETIRNLRSVPCLFEYRGYTGCHWYGDTKTRNKSNLHAEINQWERIQFFV